MVNNIFSFDDFKGKKKSSIQESITNEDVAINGETTQVNEMVDAIDDFYRVSVDVDLPKSLVSTYIKKVKDQTGKDLRADMGEKRLAERLVQWANENYLNIENLPVEIVTGSDKVPAQTQAQTQAQSQVQAQPAGTDDVDTAAAQTAPVQNTDAQKPAVQVQGQQQAQTAAAQVPAQEI